MKIEERKTISNLTRDHVSIKTQRYLTENDGAESTVGDLHSIAYWNTDAQRAMLAEHQPQEIVAAVFAIWGDTPTVADPETTDEERG